MVTATGPSKPLSDRLSVLVVDAATDGNDVYRHLVGTEGITATRVTNGSDCLARLGSRGETVDCILLTDDLAEMPSTELIEEVREEHSGIPVVLVATEGSEDLASRALAAGATDYLPADAIGDDFDVELRNRLTRAVTTYRARRETTRHANQFDALFDDQDTFLWVVGTDGRISQVNDTATAAVSENRANLLGTRFEKSRWWDGSRTDRETVENAFRSAMDGDVVRFETDVRAAERFVELDLSFRPVTNGVGEVTSVIVEGTDISERVQLERDLRQSEELHRVTLNNMTDTVLVTDDEGAFTYICPNVHFIFGYSAGEIREMGNIDEVLGADLFEDEELESEGVLTNVECTATDKRGREHTLLVNVRDVSIQGGTTLYSCRDITKRKERERALTALHRTSRNLLYAETEAEVAEIAIDDATEILDLDACGVYLFDSEANELWPAAVTGRRLSESVSRLSLEEPGPSGEAFVEQTARRFGEGNRGVGGTAPDVAFDEGIAVPLSDHGVLVVGSDGPEGFDSVTEEIVDLLAATTEAALDRVERETELRERDVELEQRNRQLLELDRTNEIIREIDQTLIAADSRAEIEHAVCDRLTGDGRFAFAWVGRVEPGSDRVHPKAWSGDGRGYLDSVRLSKTESREPSVLATTDGDTTVVTSVGKDLSTAPWRREALSRGYQSVVSVPLSRGDAAYGVLTVYADRPDAFEDRGTAILSELGETTAAAIQAIERKEALVSDQVTELDYRLTDSNCVFRTMAAAASCDIELVGGVQQTEHGVRLLASLDSAELRHAIEAMDELTQIQSVRLVSDDECLIQVTIAGEFVATFLAEHGAAVESLRATPDAAHLSVVVPRPVDARTIDRVLTGRYPNAELLAQRTNDRPALTGGRFRARITDRLTDRQLEVAQMAHHSGYFETPRRNGGEEVANRLGISSTAFYDHVRNVQQKLFTELFSETQTHRVEG
ncbi:bacterio-opsin activator domain-containing protein [Halobium salinum]|uniref:Bacterio-opsin activator domain-containing protein n=1 Tax=Halobium salinum TaxID=1364940 RepID=A0ABD5PBT0_9EURY|nr:bacterio-opsin activator domain-containing protein [Halobium salinum]